MHALVQCTLEIHSNPRRKGNYMLTYKDALVDQGLLSRPSKKIVSFFTKKRILEQVGGFLML